MKLVTIQSPYDDSAVSLNLSDDIRSVQRLWAAPGYLYDSFGGFGSVFVDHFPQTPEAPTDGTERWACSAKRVLLSQTGKRESPLPPRFAIVLSDAKEHHVEEIVALTKEPPTGASMFDLGTWSAWATYVPTTETGSLREVNAQIWTLDRFSKEKPGGPVTEQGASR